MLTPTLEDAILLAVQAHWGQRDKVGQPYVLHPLRLLLRLSGETERMAAVLHDVVEDTPYTLAQLRELGYPEPVLSAVDHLTRREDETYEAFIERLSPNAIARRVKLADLEDNIDLRRLAEVTPHDYERLVRYRKAWGRLMARES